MNPEVSRRMAWAMSKEPLGEQYDKFVDAAENAPSFAALDKNVKDYIEDAERKHGRNPAHVATETKAIKPELSRPASQGVPKFVPGPNEVERAISRLAILPNPAHPEIANPDKFVESPWQIIEPPQVDPNIWDDAEVSLVRFDSMTGTDAYLKRKNVRKHIESMGSSLLPYRSYALILVKDGRNIIIDGHHRLMALWLLGLEEAPVWKVKD